MQKYILLLVCLTAVACREAKRRKIEDPFSVVPNHFTNTLDYYYSWLSNQFFSVISPSDKDRIEKLKVEHDDEKFQLRLTVRGYKADDLQVKITKRYIKVIGLYYDEDIEDKDVEFVKTYMMPLGTKPEEVTASLKNGYLTIIVPKHQQSMVDRDVPIEDLDDTGKPEIKPTTEEKVESSTTVTTTLGDSIPTSSDASLENFDLAEDTTHIGKIRKKDLKTTTKITTDSNEVIKGSVANDLDYAQLNR